MKKLRQENKIFIAGHKGLVGSALVRVFRKNGYNNLLIADRKNCDLENWQQVSHFFKQEKPDAVILSAAKVGGIWANQTMPYDFIHKNLLIETNVIQASHESNVENFVFLGSSCIYPKMASQPISESSLLTGPLEPTNRPYALAKIAGIELCWSLNRQFGRKYWSAMPTNLYGIEDSFDLNYSHVLPALLRKFHEAKINNSSEVTVWGSGEALREFLFSDDLANAILFLLENPDLKENELFSEDLPPLINIGSGEELKISELVLLIKNIVGYEGRVVWDKTKPDGTPRKKLDTSRLNRMGWSPQVELLKGIELVYKTNTLFKQ